jgi:hypothetical protein
MSWPLAIICVPTSRLISPECRRASNRSRSPARARCRDPCARCARRERFRQALLALLRTRAEVVEVFAAALGAAGGHGAPEAAVVALEPLAFAGHDRRLRRALVVGERDGAVLALQLFAAGAADDGEGVAAAVEQDQRLLAAVERGWSARPASGRRAAPSRFPETRWRMSTSSTAGSGRFITRSRISMR